MLTLEQIKELIISRPHRKEIDRAVVHQNRLKFHTETEINKNELSPYILDFINWICTEQPELLSKDKVDRFKQLMTCPLPTVQLTEAINISLSRVFEGQDAFFRYDFEDDVKEDDWEEFRDDEFWRTDAFQAMINAIDSVWVVDLPEIQEGDKPEPKNQFINIKDVIDLLCKKTGECEYLIFRIGDRLLVYDDISIRKFAYEKSEIGDLISEFTHGIGYCPARMFWSEFLKSSNWINRKAPLTNVLSELDWLLVHKIFKKYMDISNSFAILVKYKSGDDFSDLTREINKGRPEEKKQTKGKEFVGPGTILEVPIPIEGQPDLMSNPVSWVVPPVESLEFHVSEDQRLTDYIFKTSVGIDGEQTNDQAKNEKQVLASFENQSIILRRLANNFEKIQTFAEEVIIFLRYGEHVTVSIDYGSKFFLKTTKDLMSERELVKDDDIISDSVNTEMIESKFRNDSGGKIRANVINDLDPLPGKNIDEIIKIKNAGGIDDSAFKIKVNLLNFVRRFERDQLPIAQFMSAGEYRERVDLIKNEFLKYASEFKNGNPDRGGESKLLPLNGRDPNSGPETTDVPDSQQETDGTEAD